MGVKSTWSISRKTAIEYLETQDEEKVLDAINYWIRNFKDKTVVNFDDINDDDLALILEDVLADAYKNFFVCNYKLKKGDRFTIYNTNQLNKK